mmetsp:Transcript_224/g.445  ORF Transcript_224/g.445 Transcript_224/m.445 type:complete len:107 (-) Transcript_224:368-688(-)
MNESPIFIRTTTSPVNRVTPQATESFRVEMQRYKVLWMPVLFLLLFLVRSNKCLPPRYYLQQVLEEYVSRLSLYRGGRSRMDDWQSIAKETAAVMTEQHQQQQDPR